MSRHLGIFSAALSPDLRESIHLARTLGFDALQVPVLSSAVSLPALSRSGQREISHLLSSHNLQLSSLVTSTGRQGLSPTSDTDRVLAHLEQSLKSAADLRVSCLCVDLGPLPPPPPEEKPASKPIDPLALGALILPTSAPTSTPASSASIPRDERFESHLDAALLALGQLADRYSVVVAFRSELGSLASLHRALMTARCPLFALDVDPVALLQEKAANGWDVERTLTSFAGRIGHLRVRDALLGTGGRTQPAMLGQGDARLGELAALLDQASFSGPITLDPTDLPPQHRSPAALGQSLAFVRKLWSPASR